MDKGGRFLQGQRGVGFVPRRRLGGLVEAEEAETSRSVAVALNRPADASANAITALQRLAGNEAVVQLEAEGAGPAVADGPKSPPPGPYTGSRRRNDPMDWFEDNQHLFKPSIFRDYGPYPDLWSPLARLLETLWVTNEGSDAGIRLETADQRVAAWVIIERFNAAKAAALREQKAGPRRDEALLDAVYGELADQYTFARNRGHAEWLHTNFRLFHEWLAVRFGRAPGGYAYWAKNAAGS